MSTTQLTLERGKFSKPAADLCQGGRVRVAYDHYWDTLSVNNGTNTMVEKDIAVAIEYNSAWEEEILETFFQEQKITPTFIYDDDTYPVYDEEAGEWTGAVGMVSI